MMQERSLYISVEKIDKFFSKIILLYGIFIFDRIDASPKRIGEVRLYFKRMLFWVETR